MDTVSEQENIEVIHQAYAAFGQGDVSGVLAMLTEDVRWSTPGPPELIPYAGSRTGHEQVAGYFEAFGGAVEVTEFEPQKFFAEEDMVVVLGHYAFRVRSTAKAVCSGIFVLLDDHLESSKGTRTKRPSCAYAPC
jgi:ketosteroid isomerase-like protein